ncbi:CYTH domain-containing protein [Chromatium okenii]|uniref:Adenylate cyclase n=1 Tax=Chromatium okenii TaxID=61644 RepID=A0A2S7XMK7_9GAMM|nr:CYTH domain-containing protein [Chromatium okenii]PQJ94960.1 adenylate cyclase [Chromatium okenii]
MGIEIERKFLVCNDNWRSAVISEQRLVQGYLIHDPRLTVRVRIQGDAAQLTIKGATSGISRSEFEYPNSNCRCGGAIARISQHPLIDKTRYQVRCAESIWEVDVFAGANAGLILAEIELPTEDAAFTQPEWLDAEVSDDSRYYNVNLAAQPFSCWAAIEATK